MKVKSKKVTVEFLTKDGNKVRVDGFETYEPMSKIDILKKHNLIGRVYSRKEVCSHCGHIEMFFENNDDKRGSRG